MLEWKLKIAEYKSRKIRNLRCSTGNPENRRRKKA